MEFATLFYLAVSFVVITIAATYPAEDLHINEQARKKNNCTERCPVFIVAATVCGLEKYDGPIRNFGSDCELEKFNCENNRKFMKIADGPCPESICVVDCPKGGMPVCARLVSGGPSQTFNNECALANLNCRVRPNYVKISNKACPKGPGKPAGYTV